MRLLAVIERMQERRDLEAAGPDQARQERRDLAPRALGAPGSGRLGSGRPGNRARHRLGANTRRADRSIRGGSGLTWPWLALDRRAILNLMSEPARKLPEERDDRPQEDHFVILREVSWTDYERMLALRGERSVPRLTYLRGTLEIMSPSRSHESIKSVLGRLVEAWCLEHDIDFSPYGSWTLKDEEKERGAEPDECYVFGSDPDPERPDLAIEVIWTSGRIDKLEVYRMLGVREVWYWRRGRITPYVLRGERYHAAKRSKALPTLDLEVLASFVDLAPPVSAAVRAYRDALRAGS